MNKFQKIIVSLMILAFFVSIPAGMVFGPTGFVSCFAATSALLVPLLVSMVWS